jgi:Tol biopolymer transport system component
MYTSFESRSRSDLWILPRAGGRNPDPFVASPFDKRGSQFSPDGRWVAYQSNESGRFEIFVRPFPESDGQWQVSTAGGTQVSWSADGKELYYLAPDGNLMAVPIRVSGPAVDPGTPIGLFRPPIWGGGLNQGTRQQYDVGRDGRFLVNTSLGDATTSPLTLIVNWPELLKR